MEKWLIDMMDYLESVAEAHLPSVPVIQAQLQESTEALKDMATLLPTLSKVNQAIVSLQERLTPQYKQVSIHKLLED
ncbi:unnamed protein product [Protopolystoma xenopodis]|uniref:Uncharacterized protein n=1 Tax=Protopolystoma xenopodis TaxID=117903 RepID=A0A3S5BR63_9PLAT|nr:unnamed protein product [Protopolystoma xenopodis]